MRNDFTPIETREIDDTELDSISGGEGLLTVAPIVAPNVAPIVAPIVAPNVAPVVAPRVLSPGR
jgi:hypothetical protein